MNKIITPLLIAILVVMSTLTGYFYYKLNRLSSSTTSSKTSVSNDDLLLKVSKLILLPNDEVPTIATVTDLEKLKDQSFFSKAKIGDKVIIYSKAKKAFLYNPESNRVVEVAPIDAPVK